MPDAGDKIAGAHFRAPGCSGSGESRRIAVFGSCSSARQEFLAYDPLDSPHWVRGIRSEVILDGAEERLQDAQFPYPTGPVVGPEACAMTLPFIDEVADVEQQPTEVAMDLAVVLRRYADAWKAGDLAQILGLYHDDFRLHYFGDSPLAGTHHGKDAATKVLADATVRSGRVLVQVVDALVGDQLGALVVIERLGPADHTRQLQRVLLYRIEDDKLRECWLFDEDQRFVDQLWSGAG